MNSRTRVLKILNNEIPDRYPLDGWFSEPIWRKIKKYFNQYDDEVLLEELGIDFRPVLMKPPSGFKQDPEFLDIIGKGLVASDYIVRKIDKKIYEDEWGVKISVDSASGNWNYIYHPLEDSLSLKNLKIPDLNIPERFEGLGEEIKKLKEKYFVYTGISTLFRKGWILCGYSKFLELLLLDRSFVDRLMDNLLEFTIQEVKKYVELGVDMIEFLGDLGSEESMFISPGIWREIFKPRIKEIIDNVKKTNLFFFLHSDGNIREIIPDLVEIGINILNPIQPECMDPSEIKRIFGTKMVLHGTMSSQRTFVFGEPEDVIREVNQRIESCGYNGGLILAPSNVLTDDVPVENIISFYNHVKNFKTQV